ncbi:chalcone isomerase family protein [Pseudoalteromonas sp. SSDWG2]|uniref:chalcone isomerase family protein n=1 Tax=Pseudoalteromonas sp. SSDWG2 TaxID=3139391 RepID=UPI003BA8B491
MKQMSFRFIGCVLMLACVSAHANMKLVGEAKLTYMFWDVYNATLYTPTGQYQFGQHPMRLTLTYLRDFEAEDIVEATKEQWQELGHPEYVQLFSQHIEQAWPDIAQGDSLTFETNEHSIGAFYHNDEFLVSIDDSQFSDAFTAIWLSEKTTEPKLRKKLIGDAK